MTDFAAVQAANQVSHNVDFVLYLKVNNMIFFRLAIYYLHSTSKSYKEANVELKKKLQTVMKACFFFCFDSR